MMKKLSRMKEGIILLIIDIFVVFYFPKLYIVLSGCLTITNNYAKKIWCYDFRHSLTKSGGQVLL
jgi:hypothetical protein